MNERAGRAHAGVARLLGCALLVGTAQARVPMPYDWSHGHLIYSNPDTAQEALAKGQYYAWLRNITGITAGTWATSVNAAAGLAAGGDTPTR